MSELGRNIIDLEQLKNARDAQQAQTQNQFLAQLNQTMLGRQQLGAQTQQSNNALMMQALQQQIQQRNQDRDFGLRQTAQQNQAQQFKDSLAADIERYKTQISPSTQNTIARANEERMYRNELAKGKAAEAGAAWTKLLKDYEDEKAAIVKDTPSYFKPWFWDNWNVKDALATAEKVHKKKKDDFVASLGQFREVLNITEDPSDPFKTRFEPIILPPIDFSRIGQPDVVKPVPVAPPRAVETGIGPLPINPFPQNATSARLFAPNPLDVIPGFGAIKSGIAGLLQRAPQRLNQADLVPMTGPNGQIGYVPKDQVQAWIQQQWQLPQANTNAPANSFFDPLPAY